uniref:Uncharacterized protein n=1 Tax=Mimiviridae sp. ChoanoV1 TaxID=2596887 RepID=A0A5B8IH56_9VIRU|nr:hypothetical protein 1_190 [Mimiviridae sp. ChoanoV1]
MNAQPNFYGNNNINKVNINHEILDEISNIKPSLDAMYNIRRTDLEGPFLEDLSQPPMENLLGINVDGQYSPITDQVNALNNEPKINNVIVSDTSNNQLENELLIEYTNSNDNNLVNTINLNVNNSNDNNLVNTINSNVNNSNDNNSNDNNSNDNNSNDNNSNDNNLVNANNPVNEENKNKDTDEEIRNQINNLDNKMNNDPIVNKAFKDLYRSSMNNNILILLFLVIIGLVFAVFQKDIKKMLK